MSYWNNNQAFVPSSATADEYGNNITSKSTTDRVGYFLNPIETNSDPGINLELRSRGSQRPSQYSEPCYSPQVTLFERKLEQGDTLQKISLQCSIPVAELRRINNLISDQDFYALSSIKIPVTRYSQLDVLENRAPDATAAAHTKTIANAAEDASSETSDTLVHLSDGEFEPLIDGDWNRPREVRDSLNFHDTASTNKNKKAINKMFKNIDKSLQKAKTSADAMQKTQEENVFNANNGGGASDMFHASEQFQSAALERNIRHYLIGVLIVFLILIPICFVIYRAIVAAEDE